MNIRYVADRLNYKLWQYTFTKMYWQDDIIMEINNSLVDLYCEWMQWDFTVKTFNNTVWLPPLYNPITTSNTYTLPKYIWQVIDFYGIRNNQHQTFIYKKYWQFSNWNNPWMQVNEYYRSWKTVTLSETMDIEMVYLDSPTEYTNTDYNNSTEMDIPNDFLWRLIDNTMASMALIFLSDGWAISDKYFSRSQWRLWRLATKYGKKYAVDSVAAATPELWHSRFVRTQQISWGFSEEF